MGAAWYAEDNMEGAVIEHNTQTILQTQLTSNNLGLVNAQQAAEIYNSRVMINDPLGTQNNLVTRTVTQGNMVDNGVMTSQYNIGVNPFNVNTTLPGSVAPVGPMNPINPMNTLNPLNAANQVNFINNIGNPLNPINPLNTTNSINPLHPIDPLNPLNNTMNPLNPIDPLNPLNPLTPVPIVPGATQTTTTVSTVNASVLPQPIPQINVLPPPNPFIPVVPNPLNPLASTFVNPTVNQSNLLLGNNPLAPPPVSNTVTTTTVDNVNGTATVVNTTSVPTLNTPAPPIQGILMNPLNPLNSTLVKDSMLGIAPPVLAPPPVIAPTAVQTSIVQTNPVLGVPAVNRSVVNTVNAVNPHPLSTVNTVNTTVTAVPPGAPIITPSPVIPLASTSVISQPGLNVATTSYKNIAIPATLPLYRSTVGGGGQNAPPPNVAVPANIPEISNFIKQRMNQLGIFQTNGMEGGIYLNQAYLFTYLGIIYMGEWARGKPHGRGMMIFKNGSLYDGYFSRGKTIGLGRFFLANGDYYEGEFLGLAAHGKGFCSIGNIIYEGQFMNNLPHGTGLESTIDGHVKFYGQYNHGQKVYGKMSWDGYVYKGPFVNNLFNGFALVRTPYGIYQGNFVDGTMVSGTPLQDPGIHAATYTNQVTNHTMRMSYANNANMYGSGAYGQYPGVGQAQQYASTYQGYAPNFSYGY